VETVFEENAENESFLRCGIN